MFQVLVLLYLYEIFCNQQNFTTTSIKTESLAKTCQKNRESDYRKINKKIHVKFNILINIFFKFNYLAKFFNIQKSILLTIIFI